MSSSIELFVHQPPRLQRALGIALLTLSLSACQLFAPKPVPHRLLWSFDGKVAVRAEQAVTAQIQWQQFEADFVIRLNGPLGLGAVKLSGSPALATLETHQGTHTGPLKPLLGRVLQMDVPTEAIPQWLMGKTLARQPTEQRDAEGRLIAFEENGYQVSLRDYREVNGSQAGRQLPHNIVIRPVAHPDHKLILAIHQWRLFP